MDFEEIKSKITDLEKKDEEIMAKVIDLTKVTNNLGASVNEMLERNNKLLSIYNEQATIFQNATKTILIKNRILTIARNAAFVVGGSAITVFFEFWFKVL